MVFLDDLLGLELILFSLLGVLVTRFRNRALLLGFWSGYLVFGLFFPYHILTHDYYHLPLIAILSLSIMPLMDLIIGVVVQRSWRIKTLFVVTLLAFFAYNAWIARSIIVGQDFRDHPAFWQEIGEIIPDDTEAIGLTQDYGMRLMYYGWQKISLWPRNANPEELPQVADGASYFVVTAKNQMSSSLEHFLTSHYKLFAEGPGYIVFDLSEPLTP
jgi:hypothetical protein